MKYLLQAIEAKRDVVRLSDAELRKLLVEVRSGKDDRIEFIEAMVRLIEELRSSEHATAFLTKVAKRDAPDYYDVIKSPMDLGTMLRNVKSSRYKTKAQFMRDLDLIWDNCLTYNSEPTHPLRRSVQLIRAKANHLLTYVNDTNDVKEALSHWQASSGAASDGNAESTTENGLSWTNSPLNGTVNGLRRGSIMPSGRSINMGLKRVNVSLSDTPFEQRTATLRSVDGMSTFSTLDEALSRADEHFARTYLHPRNSFEQEGSSSRSAGLFDSEPAAASGITANALGDTLRTLESSNVQGVLQSALTMGPQGEEEEITNGAVDEDADVHSERGSNGTTNGLTTNGTAKRQGKKRDSSPIPYPFHLDQERDGVDSERYQLGAWWSAIDRSSLLASGIAPLGSSAQVEPGPSRMVGHRPRRKRRRREEIMDKTLFGGLLTLEANVKTISRLRKTHAKYGALMSHIEHEEPIPAALAVVSSDESEGEEAEKDEGKRHRGRARYKNVDMPPPYLPDPKRDPLPKLSSEGATDLIESNTQLVLAHAGFEGAQRGAAGVLADVTAEYIMNMGRTLRMYTDQFAKEMSVEEIILHALFENGGMDVRSLESYIVDDVMRYGSKMSELLRKLQSSYRDTLNSASFTMEDEAYFADNGEGENTQIMSGTFAQDMGDDFFGFKEMGLDKELGIDMSQLVVPSKLFHRGAAAAAAAAAAASGSAGGVRLGLGRGGSSAANGAGGRGSGAGGPNEVVMFEPPPPYVPISEASVPAQIGLLQSFYRDLLRTRGQWQEIERQQDADYDEEEEEEEDEDEEEEEEEEEGEGEGGRRSRSRKRIFILPEEEMERQRYKVPPNGKMPKRTFKPKAGGGGSESNAKETKREKGTGGNTSSTIQPQSQAKSKNNNSNNSTSNSSKKKKKSDA